MNEQEYFVIGVDVKELQRGLKELTKDEFLKTLANFQLNALISMIALGLFDLPL